jgi:hypothetical protein
MTTPWGATMSVAMTNCGEAGWLSDRGGYGYDRIDPETGRAVAGDDGDCPGSGGGLPSYTLNSSLPNDRSVQQGGLAGHPIRIDPDRRICSGAVRLLAATDIQFWRGAPVDPDGTWLSAASARSRSRRNSFMRARIRAKSSAAQGWIIGSSRSLDLVLTAARSFCD